MSDTILAPDRVPILTPMSKGPDGVVSTHEFTVEGTAVEIRLYRVHGRMHAGWLCPLCNAGMGKGGYCSSDRALEAVEQYFIEHYFELHRGYCAIQDEP